MALVAKESGSDGFFSVILSAGKTVAAAGSTVVTDVARGVEGIAGPVGDAAAQSVPIWVANRILKDDRAQTQPIADSARIFDTRLPDPGTRFSDGPGILVSQSPGFFGGQAGVALAVAAAAIGAAFLFRGR